MFFQILKFLLRKNVLLNSVQLFRPKLQDQPSTTTSSSGTKKRSPKSPHAQTIGGIPRHPTSGEDYKPPREKRSKEKRSKKSRSDQYQQQSGTEPPDNGGATATTAIGNSKQSFLDNAPNYLIGCIIQTRIK